MTKFIITPKKYFQSRLQGMASVWFFTETSFRVSFPSNCAIKQVKIRALETTSDLANHNSLRLDIQRIQDEIDFIPELQDHGRDSDITVCTHDHNKLHAIVCFDETTEYDVKRSISWHFRGQKIKV